METRQGNRIEALSEETERQQAILPKSRRHSLTLQGAAGQLAVLPTAIVHRYRLE
ncbi:MAG: hypothetical protein NTZ74_01295 [Chloroflexi bacterium]|nr:hypothetical protein [Chloroflexota bacterium]